MRDDDRAGSPAADDARIAQRPSVLSSATMLGAATVLAKLAALAKDWLVARQLGAGDELDAYLIAFLIPSYAVVVLAQSFSSAFVPTYVRVWQRDGLAPAQQLTSRLLASGTLLLAVVTVILMAVAGWLLPLVGIGFDAEKLALTRRLFYPLALVVVVSGISAMLAAVLIAHERFAAVAIAPVAIPLVTLLVFGAFGDRYGTYALAGGTLAGFVVELGVLGLAAWRLGLLPTPRFRAPEGETRHVVSQYLPLVLGAVLMSSSLVVDQTMAASLGRGQVSVLSYGGKIVAVVLTAVAVSLSTVLFPRFSRMIAAGRFDELRRTFGWYARMIVLASIPGVALLALFSEPLVRLIFERGAFTPQTTAAVNGVQLWLLLQIPFYVVNMLGARVLSAMDGNHTVLAIGALNLVVNVTGNLVLMRWFGVDGIAMSTSLVYVVAAAATLWAIRLKLAERTALVE
jgi:putative peptidoglycan lipid II flippase